MSIQSQSKREITTVQDIELMVNRFYDKVNQDELLSPVFNEFAKVDWEHHLPTMYGFWSKILLGTGEYTGSPFPKHSPLPINKSHFDRWLLLFEENLKELFEGELADEALLRAKTIGLTFNAKLEYLNKMKDS